MGGFVAGGIVGGLMQLPSPRKVTGTGVMRVGEHMHKMGKH